MHPVTALEIEYSLATRFIEGEIRKVCRELGIGIVAYGVLSRGLLSGKLDGSFEKGDFRSITPRYTGRHLKSNLARVETLADIAHAKGCTPAQLAIAWVIAQGDDIVPLIGTSRRDRLSENLGAGLMDGRDDRLAFTSGIQERIHRISYLRPWSPC